MSPSFHQSSIVIIVDRR